MAPSPQIYRVVTSLRLLKKLQEDMYVYEKFCIVYIAITGDPYATSLSPHVNHNRKIKFRSVRKKKPLNFAGFSSVKNLSIKFLVF